MADEKVTPTEEVGDAELSEAFDKATGVKATEVKEEVKEVKTETEEEAPEEPAPAEEQQASQDEEEELTHQEKSRLGRKVKGLYDKIDQLTATIERLNQPKAEEPEPEVPEIISTPADIDKYLEAKARKESQAKSQYEQSYIKQVDTLKRDNEDLHDEIFEEMLKNHNVRYSDNAFADARINYAEAKAAVLSKKVSGKTAKVPARVTATKAPAQPAASASRSTAREISLPTLDAQAQSYVAYLRKQGMSDADIAKELA